MELLNHTRALIDSLYLNGSKGPKVTAKKKKLELPIAIAVGYYVLSEIIGAIRR